MKGPDEARFDHDPGTGKRHGLLVEAGAVNRIGESDALWSPAWVGDQGGGVAPVVTQQAGAAPDGSDCARIHFVRGAGFSRLAVSSPPMAAGVSAVFSVWLKAAAAPGPSVALRCNVTNGATLELTSQWRRYSLEMTGADENVSCQLLLWSSIAGAPAEAEIFAWGAQFELGTRASSLIATSGAPAARAADTLMLDWSSRGVSDGERRIRYGFDDGSAVEVPTAIAGGHAAVPLPPAGRWLTRAEAL